MENRLSKIITKTGDKGSTGIGDGKRTSKNNPIIHVLGELDELNCSIGLLKAKLKEYSLKEEKYNKFIDILIEIQNDLFNLGGEISSPKIQLLDISRIHQITELANILNNELEPLKEFILPGNSHLSGLAHFIRAICRRTERNFVNMIENNEDLKKRQFKSGLPYLNRLSDLFFIISRHLDMIEEEETVYWKKPEA